MSTKELTKFETNLQGYEALRFDVKQVLIQGRQNMEREKVLTYWKTGEVIGRYLTQFESQTAQRKRIIGELSKDLKVDKTVLHRMVKFASLFPKVARGQLLSWSHYRVLIGVTSNDQRFELEREALRETWSAETLRAEIKLRLPAPKAEVVSDKAVTLLTPRRGRFQTYFIKEVGGEPMVDLGFEIYRPLDAELVERTKPGTAVEFTREGLQPAPANLTRSDVFTYKAKVLKIVDGDTLRVLIDLGFNTQVRQYLRLRGLNTPELDTPAGRTAKVFLADRLQAMPYIILSSTRSDKYDRYLSDIFYIREGHERYLNNELLESGLAVSV